MLETFQPVIQSVTGTLSPGVKRLLARNRRHNYFVLSLAKSGSKPPLPHTPFMSYTVRG